MSQQQGKQSQGPSPTPMQVDPGTVGVIDVASNTLVGWCYRASGSTQEHFILMTGNPKFVAPPARAIRLEKNTTLCGANGCGSLSAFLSACAQALGSNTAVYVIYDQTQSTPFPP